MNKTRTNYFSVLENVNSMSIRLSNLKLGPFISKTSFTDSAVGGKFILLIPASDIFFPLVYVNIPPSPSNKNYLFKCRICLAQRKRKKKLCV